MEENEKSSNTSEKKPNKIKLIDYSKFQHKFNNNNKQTKNNDKKDFIPNNDIIKENNINEIDNKKTNEITKQKI